MSRKPRIWGGVCPLYGPSQQTINFELMKEAPDCFEKVDDFSQADICIDYIIGDPDRPNLVHPKEKDWSEQLKLRASSDMFSNIYLTLCNITNTDFYKYVFQDSLFSYTYINKNMIPFDANDEVYFRGPLGVNSGSFYPIKDNGIPLGKAFMIYAFGMVKETESIDIIFEAVREASKQTEKPAKMLHTGNDLGYDPEHYVFAPFADPRDQRAVPYKYTISYFASALRRDAEKEGGFELANLEAPLTDCRPITYNIEPYEHWFKDTSLLVSLDNTKDDLVKIFSDTLAGNYEGYRATVGHRDAITTNFSWDSVSETFWQEVVKRCKAQNLLS